MKIFLICIFIISTLVLLPKSAPAEENVVLQGRLFKQNDKWCIFVESDNTFFKKGVLQLIKIPDSSQKKLIEKSFVKIKGYQEKCDSPHVCFVVQKVESAVNNY